MQRDDFEMLRFPSLETYRSGSEKKLDVLIAAEEILGPVRNGGIASTYYHLARGLAAQGHKVTVLYLKGRVVENKTPKHWIAHFAEFGIEFIYLDLPDQPLAGAAVDWQARHYAFYCWLKANDRFAVVHSSEWRGGAFYCLSAKRLGLAFRDTLFIVKTSSPYIWNRHYQMRPIDKLDLLAAAFAEQKCVEWADMVVGGSAHLLSFMAHIGYRLPEGRCFVQPNIVDFSEIKVEDSRPARAFGDIVKTREIVFFGRLEPRKGLELFCAAIDALVARQTAPDRIVFLGKEGERLSNHDNVRPIEFIEAHSAQWPIEIDIVTDRNQPEALSLMCSRDMIAVMPSLIENSTMAVHEALVHKIPFVATAVGGTPELIHPADHAACLVEPDGLALAERLGSALTNGQQIARAAFDNEENLGIWYDFHGYVAKHGADAIAEAAPVTSQSERITRIVAPRDKMELAAIARGIASGNATGFDETIVCVGFLLGERSRALITRLAETGVRVLETVGASAGEAFDAARSEASGTILLFDLVGTAVFDPRAAETLKAALAAQPNNLIGFAFSFDPKRSGRPDTLFLPLGGDIASHHLGNDAYGLEIIAGRRESFSALGGFEPHDVIAGILHEYVTRAVSKGRDYMIAPEPLIAFDGDRDSLVRRNANYEYLKDKPLIETVPLAIRKLWLFRGRSETRPMEGGIDISLVRPTHRIGNEAVWFSDPSRIGDPAVDAPRRGRILLGFDRANARVRAALLHQGRLTVSVNGRTVRDQPAFGARGVLNTMAIEILPFFAVTDRLRVRIEWRRGSGRRSATLIFHRIESEVFLMTSRDVVYWNDDFDQALALLGGSSGDLRRRPALKREPRRPGDSFIARLRETLESADPS